MLNLLSEKIKKAKGDYIEIRLEDNSSTSVSVIGGDIERAGSSSTIGGAIRVLYNGGWGFVSFNDLDSIDTFLNLAYEQAKAVGSLVKSKISSKYSNIKDEVSTVYIVDPNSVSLKEKVERSKNYSSIAQNGVNITNSSVNYQDFKKVKYFVSSLGSAIKETTVGCGVAVSVMAKDGDNIQRAFLSIGEMKGYEIVKNQEAKIEDLISEVNEKLKAPKVVGGRKTVVLDNHLTGVFTHEAFGHLSEADFIYKNKDFQKKMKLGTVFGKDILNIYDSGLDANMRGGYFYDDEGVPAQKTQLIKDGILTGRLHSRETAGMMGEEPTGNARALNYRFAPIVRMSSTYIEAGNSTFEEMIADVEDGIYACGMLGGNTDLEMFTFSSAKAYSIKNGKIEGMVRDVVLSGNVFETLKGIDKIGRDEKLYGGMGGCGKDGQSPLPVSDGGPHIRIQNVLVG